jgi:hypothetical protein
MSPIWRLQKSYAIPCAHAAFPSSHNEKPDPPIAWRTDNETQREHKRQRALDIELRKRTLREIAHYDECRLRRHWL